jgi:glutathione S-transferase
MLELIQFPWSPFCLVQRRILEYAGVPFKITNVSCTDRTLIWRLTRQRYYQVPVLRDGRMVVFETDDNSQVIAKYLDTKLKLDLFPRHLAGVQNLIWLYIENQVEEMTFKLNDIFYREFVPAAERVNYLRHKERKFGRSCLDQWRREAPLLRQELTRRLMPFEQMLQERDFLLDSRPRFVDFDLWGILANLLYTGHHRLPGALPLVRRWHRRISTARWRDLNDI